MLRDRAWKKALAELYGGEKTEAQAERYARLAELASRDAAACGAASGMRFYSAPGRTELGGNHTDHNRGLVLCAAVGLDVAAAVAPTGDSTVRLVSEGYPEPIVADLSDLQPKEQERGKTEALIRGVAKGLADRGVAPTGFAGRMHSHGPCRAPASRARPPSSSSSARSWPTSPGPRSRPWSWPR